MKYTHFFAGVSLLSASFYTNAHTDMECTDKPKAQWLHVLDIQKKIVNEHGFAIKKFQEAGSCYEIYGWGKSKDGEKFEEVEVYFNPVTGEIVKKKFRD